MICLSLAETTVERALEHAATYQRYIDMCELRADYLTTDNAAVIAQVPALLQQHCAISQTILTIRRVGDGGRYADSEESRQELLLDILRQDVTEPFTYLDLEIDMRGDKREAEIRALTTQHHMTIIRSVHQYAPSAMAVSTLLEQVTAYPNEIGKVAVAVTSLAEVCAVYEQLHAFRARAENAAKPIVVIAMGEYGTILRILAKRIGLFCTYCSVPRTEVVAPGQLDPVTLQELYAYHEIDKTRKLFAVIGNPIAHSQSPAYHNRIFRARRLAACYLPIKCDALPVFRRLAALLPLHGCSVTLPHKEDIVAHLHHADDAVRLIGSCNTVIIKGSTWYGYNTDLYGFEQPLRRIGLLSAGRGKAQSALVIGAGGVARTVCVSLLTHGYRLCIANRSAERAHALAAALRTKQPNAHIRTAPLSRAMTDQAAVPTLIVQTTSVGMHPHITDPIPFYSFDGTEVVYDLIYNPPRTALLQRAERAGCMIIGGEEMFSEQAKQQSQYFMDCCMPND